MLHRRLKRRSDAERTLGRVRYVHPDCGMWMLPRSVADAKLRSLVKGRNTYLGQG